MHIENEKEAAMVSSAGKKTNEQMKSEKKSPLFRAGEYIFSTEKSAEGLRQEFADFIDKVLEKGNDNIESLKILLAAELFGKGIRLEEKDLGKLFWSLVADRLKTEFRLIAEKLIETGAYLMSEEKLEEQVGRSLLGLLKRLSRSMEREKSRGDHLSELDFRFHKYLQDQSRIAKSRKEEDEPMSLKQLLDEAARDSRIQIKEKEPTKVRKLTSGKSENAKRAISDLKLGIENPYRVPEEISMLTKIPFEMIKPGILLEVEEGSGALAEARRYEIVGVPSKQYEIRVKDRDKMGVAEELKFGIRTLYSLGVMSDRYGFFHKSNRLISVETC